MPDRPLNREFFESELEIRAVHKFAQFCINGYPQSLHKYPHTAPSNKTRPILCTTLQTKRSHRNLCRNRQSRFSEIHEVLNNVQANKCNLVRPQISETSEGRSFT